MSSAEREELVRALGIYRAGLVEATRRGVRKAVKSDARWRLFVVDQLREELGEA